MAEQIDARRLRCIVKLGGAAITCKNELERINEENLEIVSEQLRQAMRAPGSSGKVVGMDWSNRPGFAATSCSFDDSSDQPAADLNRFIVVHGAGSFGHFQASKSGVHKGGLDQPLVKAGFVATRISVTYLNLEIVRALAREGIPSVGLSPFACGWSTCKRNIFSADASTVAKTLDSGFVPVLHGDAVFDVSQDCTILSGDVIIRHLAAELKPEFVVFLGPRTRHLMQGLLALLPKGDARIAEIRNSLQKIITDVLGVYDRPPTEPNAVLLREIEVREDGSWYVVKPTLQKEVETSVAAHDTTGGMLTKISEAAMIAKLGIDVYIVKAATGHSLRALSGELKAHIPEGWLGTAIRFAR